MATNRDKSDKSDESHSIKIFAGIYSRFDITIYNIMFYQNSNDLVKHASAKSGHVQNSKETREVITASQSNVLKDNNKRVSFDDDNTTSSQNPSLSIGTQFQNMIQNLFSSSLLEGLTGDGKTVVPVSSSSASGSGSGRNNDQTAYVNSMAADNNKYTQQELDHINKVKGIINLIEKNDKNTRNQWVEVSDTAGITKYGYITSDGVFQIWHAPTSPSANPTNWLQTDTIKQNIGVIGCPAQSDSTQKIKIAGTWDKIKPYELIYADTDSSRLNPLFMLINDSVRDPKNSVDRRGLFSCGNERGNVYVGERPTADFDLNNSYIKVGCYLIPDGITDSHLKNRQFTFQEDLSEASISQCKRRAEDLGSSCFFISAPDTVDKPSNKGGCWIYTGHGQPYLDGILTFNEKADKCHAMTNPEPDEDGFLKSYTISNLKRLYGKNTEVEVPPNPPNPECDHTTRSRCIFKSYHHVGDAICYPKNWNGAWAYGGLWQYNKQDLKGWLTALHNRNGDGLERDAVNEYIEKCKRTKGYEFLDSMPPPKQMKIQRAVALYYLKRGGPTGVDNVNRNSRGLVGSIAYIDHNGERHVYPQSALSFTKPASYITLNGYDTRSAESSYGLKDARIRNKFPPLATMPNWEMNIQFTLNGGSGWQPLIGNMFNDINPQLGWGLWVSHSKTINWIWKYNVVDFGINVIDRTRYNLTIVNSPTTITMVLRNMSNGTEQKVASNKAQNDVMPTEGPVTIGGWKNNSEYYKFPGKIHSISIPKLYSIDNPDMNGAEVPLSKPTPVNESVDGTLEKCSKICDDDANCGGFVYTKPTVGGAEGKCELKDRAKMFPVGVRVKDPTKQLMIKVPTINGTISDETCKVNNGAAYKIIDSAQYRHYPDKGAMTSSSKCDIRSLIPKDGDLQPIDFSSMFGAVDEVFEETKSKIAEYGAQTAVTSASNTAAEGFMGMREGMEVSSTSTTYADTMKGVGDDLKKIANAEYQRERLLAITEETNKLLMAETYKFILWSVLAILAVLALLKLKEMFGQDESEGGSGEGGGGLLATILGWFGIGSMKLDDVQDRTEDAKAALSAAGDQLREAGANLSTGITEGADNLVNSATDAATGAIEGANNLVDKAKETASGAIDQIGSPSPTTGGKRSVKRKP